MVYIPKRSKFRGIDIQFPRFLRVTQYILNNHIQNILKGSFFLYFGDQRNSFLFAESLIAKFVARGLEKEIV